MSARPRHTLRTLHLLRKILNTFVSGPQTWFFSLASATRVRHLARDAVSW